MEFTKIKCEICNEEITDDVFYLHLNKCRRRSKINNQQDRNFEQDETNLISKCEMRDQPTRISSKIENAVSGEKHYSIESIDEEYDLPKQQGDLLKEYKAKLEMISKKIEEKKLSDLNLKFSKDEKAYLALSQDKSGNAGGDYHAAVGSPLISHHDISCINKREDSFVSNLHAQNPFIKKIEPLVTSQETYENDNSNRILNDEPERNTDQMNNSNHSDFIIHTIDEIDIEELEKSKVVKDEDIVKRQLKALDDFHENNKILDSTISNNLVVNESAIRQETQQPPSTNYDDEESNAKCNQINNKPQRPGNMPNKSKQKKKKEEGNPLQNSRRSQHDNLEFMSKLEQQEKQQILISKQETEELQKIEETLKLDKRLTHEKWQIRQNAYKQVSDLIINSNKLLNGYMRNPEKVSMEISLEEIVEVYNSFYPWMKYIIMDLNISSLQRGLETFRTFLFLIPPSLHQFEKIKKDLISQFSDELEKLAGYNKLGINRIIKDIFRFSLNINDGLPMHDNYPVSVNTSISFIIDIFKRMNTSVNVKYITFCTRLLAEIAYSQYTLIMNYDFPRVLLDESTVLWVNCSQDFKLTEKRKIAQQLLTCLLNCINDSNASLKKNLKSLQFLPSALMTDFDRILVKRNLIENPKSLFNEGLFGEDEHLEQVIPSQHQEKIKLTNSINVTANLVKSKSISGFKSTKKEEPVVKQQRFCINSKVNTIYDFFSEDFFKLPYFKDFHQRKNLLTSVNETLLSIDFIKLTHSNEFQIDSHLVTSIFNHHWLKELLNIIHYVIDDLNILVYIEGIKLFTTLVEGLSLMLKLPKYKVKANLFVYYKQIPKVKLILNSVYDKFKDKKTNVKVEVFKLFDTIKQEHIFESSYTFLNHILNFSVNNKNPQVKLSLLEYISSITDYGHKTTKDDDAVIFVKLLCDLIKKETISNIKDVSTSIMLSIRDLELIQPEQFRALVKSLHPIRRRMILGNENDEPEELASTPLKTEKEELSNIQVIKKRDVSRPKSISKVKLEAQHDTKQRPKSSSKPINKKLTKSKLDVIPLKRELTLKTEITQEVMNDCPLSNADLEEDFNHYEQELHDSKVEDDIYIEQVSRIPNLEDNYEETDDPTSRVNHTKLEQPPHVEMTETAKQFEEVIRIKQSINDKINEKLSKAANQGIIRSSRNNNRVDSSNNEQQSCRTEVSEIITNKSNQPHIINTIVESHQEKHSNTLPNQSTTDLTKLHEKMRAAISKIDDLPLEELDVYALNVADSYLSFLKKVNENQLNEDMKAHFGVIIRIFSKILEVASKTLSEQLTEKLIWIFMYAKSYYSTSEEEISYISNGLLKMNHIWRIKGVCDQSNQETDESLCFSVGLHILRFLKTFPIKPNLHKHSSSSRREIFTDFLNWIIKFVDDSGETLFEQILAYAAHSVILREIIESSDLLNFKAKYEFLKRIDNCNAEMSAKDLNRVDHPQENSNLNTKLQKQATEEIKIQSSSQTQEKNIVTHADAEAESTAELGKNGGSIFSQVAARIEKSLKKLQGSIHKIDDEVESGSNKIKIVSTNTSVLESYDFENEAVKQKNRIEDKHISSNLLNHIKTNISKIAKSTENSNIKPFKPVESIQELADIENNTEISSNLEYELNRNLEWSKCKKLLFKIPSIILDDDLSGSVTLLDCESFYTDKLGSSNIDTSIEENFLKDIKAKYEMKVNFISILKETLTDKLIKACSFNIFIVVTDFCLRLLSFDILHKDYSCPKSSEQSSSEKFYLIKEIQQFIDNRLLKTKSEYTHSIQVLIYLYRKYLPKDFSSSIDRLNLIMIQCINYFMKSVIENHEQGFDSYAVLCELNELFYMHPPNKLRKELPNIKDLDKVYQTLRLVTDACIKESLDLTKQFLAKAKAIKLKEDNSGSKDENQNLLICYIDRVLKSA